MLYFLLAIIIAALVTGIFVLIFKRVGPGIGLILFFIIMFLVALAAGRWIRPFGPSLGEIYWLPMLVMAIIFALLFVAATPGNSTLEDRKTGELKESPGAQATVSVFMWIFILILFIVVVLGFLF